MVEKISAVTLRVTNMQSSVRFYKNVLGLEIIYGGEGSAFHISANKRGHSDSEPRGRRSPAIRWGRLIFHVSDVDRFGRT